MEARKKAIYTSLEASSPRLIKQTQFLTTFSYYYYYFYLLFFNAPLASRARESNERFRDW